MKHSLFSTWVLVLMAALPASAEPRTAVLAVPGMNCAICPLTVEKALSRVEGVDQVSVDAGTRRATVVFDDSATRAEALTSATARAGYPSTVVEVLP